MKNMLSRLMSVVPHASLHSRQQALSPRFQGNVNATALTNQHQAIATELLAVKPTLTSPRLADHQGQRFNAIA